MWDVITRLQSQTSPEKNCAHCEKYARNGSIIVFTILKIFSKYTFRIAQTLKRFWLKVSLFAVTIK